jgi:hypothetical protein
VYTVKKTKKLIIVNILSLLFIILKIFFFM